MMGTCLVAMLGSGAAFADECPADKVGQNNLVGAPTAPVGVADNELASVDLPKENVKLLERRLRLRNIAYFSPSWTAFQAERGRDFSVIVDGISD